MINLWKICNEINGHLKFDFDVFWKDEIYGFYAFEKRNLI